jgi:DNA-binding transcriptional LysR family regulator
MITLTQLEYIVAVDTYRHFGRAAENCFITQPTLSMQIKKLEEDLEIIIFDRSRHPLMPTDVGQRIVDQARIVLKQSEEINNIVKDHKNQVSGLIRIGIIPTMAPYLLPIFIGNYKRKFPNIFIKVVEENTDNIVKLLQKDLIDVGILATPLNEDKISEKPIFYEEMLIYANPSHPLHKLKEITVKDIATPVLIFEKYIYLCALFGGHGGIGRRARLRIWCQTAWGFESLCPHKNRRPSLIGKCWRLFLLKILEINFFIIMNITRENIDAVNAVLKVDIEKADYEKTVADQLKEYRQKAVVPGFRPGKVPDGLIKRKYRIPVLVEEVNKLLSKNLSQYLVDEKLNILGEPLPNEEQQKNINWETDENFEFVFDIALAPEINISR